LLLLILDIISVQVEAVNVRAGTTTNDVQWLFVSGDSTHWHIFSLGFSRVADAIEWSHIKVGIKGI
jgi:hypothetical protein